VSESRPAVAVLLPVTLLGYAVWALGLARWWISGLAAPVIAVLLWRLHPRARFAAYVFFSVVTLRGVVGRHWAAALFAVAALALMQTSAARRVWPRLRPGRTRTGSFC
jgi:hypothetical protein